jgi:hypothetical protein
MPETSSSDSETAAAVKRIFDALEPMVVSPVTMALQAQWPCQRR